MWLREVPFKVAIKCVKDDICDGIGDFLVFILKVVFIITYAIGLIFYAGLCFVWFTTPIIHFVFNGIIGQPMSVTLAYLGKFFVSLLLLYFICKDLKNGLR